MAADLKSLWTDVEAAPPSNSDPLVVCAGWCEENDEPQLALALMWAAGRQKRPFKRTDIVRQPWVWYMARPFTTRTLGRNKTRERGYAFVSDIISRAADDCVPSIAAAFPTSQAAYRWLGRGLHELRELIAAPGVVIPPAPQIVRTGPVTCRACGIMRSRDVECCPVCKSSEVLS